MKQKLSGTSHSMIMWGCAALLSLALLVAFAVNAYVLLFIIPCMLMMVAMMWMIMGGGTRGGEQK